MRPFPGRLITSLCLGIALTAPAAGQDQAPAPKTSCIVFPVQALASGNASADFEQTITDSISAALSVGGFAMLGPEAWKDDVARRGLAPRALLGAAEAVLTAQNAGAALAVTGYYVLQDQRIAISVQCWDVKTGRLLASLQQASRFNLAFYSALHDHVVELIPRLTVGGPPTTGIAESPGRFALTEIDFLSPDDGMEVLVAGERALGTISAGKLVWKNPGLSPGEILHVEKRRKGYHTETETVAAAQETRLAPLQKESAQGLEMDWSTAQMLGFGASARIYTSPDTTFFFLSTYLSAQVPLSAAGHWVTHVDGSVGLGTYVGLPPEAPIRFGLSTGIGLIVTPPLATGGARYNDPYFNVVNWWVETRLAGPIIFLRQEWKYGLGQDGLLGAGWIMANNFPPMTLGVVFRW